LRGSSLVDVVGGVKTEPQAVGGVANTGLEVGVKCEESASTEVDFKSEDTEVAGSEASAGDAAGGDAAVAAE